MFRIEYKGDRWECSIKVPAKDMAEFMDDIFSNWMKLDKKMEIVERRAREAIKARKDYLESEKEQAYNEGFREGFNVKYGFVKEVITKQEEVEQDRNEQEMEKLLIEKYKTYDNPFPTDEALEYDINVRERD